MCKLVLFFVVFTYISSENILQKNNVKFRFYGEKNVQKADRIVFIIHGYTENWHKKWYQDLTDSFLIQSNKNAIIQVDWSKIAKQSYPKSAKDTRYVGKVIAEFLLKLDNSSKIHLVGHSLGAHVAGFAGKRTLEINGKKVWRITGLDPAGPLFLTSRFDRLDRNDAEIVVVIHTDGGKYGYLNSCGHVDIFPNGGSARQPGCPSTSDFTSFCSHHRSHTYFIEAIANNSMIATECFSYLGYISKRCVGHKKINIGSDNLTVEMSGNYYLTTNPTKPFTMY